MVKDYQKKEKSKGYFKKMPSDHCFMNNQKHNSSWKIDAMPRLRF